MRLRRIVDERYTASSLLVLSQSKSPKGNQKTLENDVIPDISRENSGELAKTNQYDELDSPALLPSSSICGNYYESILSENSWLKDSDGNVQIQPSLKRVSDWSFYLCPFLSYGFFSLLDSKKREIFTRRTRRDQVCFHILLSIVFLCTYFDSV
jgi:hypothetical protein